MKHTDNVKHSDNMNHTDNVKHTGNVNHTDNMNHIDNVNHTDNVKHTDNTHRMCENCKPEAINKNLLPYPRLQITVVIHVSYIHSALVVKVA